MRLRREADDLADALLDQRARLGPCRAHVEAQRHRLRNHVVRGTAADEADRHHRRVVGRHVARHHRLQRRHDRGGRGDRVARAVRHGAVAAHALDRDVGHVGRQRDRPRHGQRGAHRHAGRVVQRVHRIAGKALEQAVFDHRARTAEVFFVGLEDQVQRAVEVARCAKRLGRRQQDGRVAVVAAGVHAARVAARVGQAGGLGDGQRVHVGANAQAARAVAQLELRHDAGLADAGVHLVAPARAAGWRPASLVAFTSKPSSGLAWIWRRMSTKACVSTSACGSRRDRSLVVWGLSSRVMSCSPLGGVESVRSIGVQAALRSRRLSSAPRLSTPQTIM
jgi:hypothetical protein